MECDKEVINSRYRNHYVYVHTSDILANGLFRAAYTVLDQNGRHMVLNFVEDKHQEIACAKAFQKAKDFIDSLKENNSKAYTHGDKGNSTELAKKSSSTEEGASEH